MNIRIAMLAPLLATLLLAACGGGAGGTYVDANGDPALTLASGNAELAFGPMKMQVKYSVDGNKILLHSPQGDLVLTRHSDGTLDTPWGTWKKK